MKKTNAFYILLFLSNIGLAQMPDTDILVFRLKQNKAGVTEISDTVQVTTRKGYDNQPSFSGDGKKIYYVSVRDDNQSDIYVYDLSGKRTKRFTQSVESEYSPQISADGRYVSSVVVERDSSQRIHLMNAVDGVFLKSLAFDSVGYFCYVNVDTLVYYKLTEPHSLRMHVLSTDEDRWICSRPTRGFKTIDRSKFLYAIKDSLATTYMMYDFALQKAKIIGSYPKVIEDACWHATQGLLIPDGPKIMRYVPNRNDWQVYLDLSSHGVKKITRVAFDANNSCMVIVTNY